MEVEVDLYSGRSNPRWRLDPTLTAELLARVAALPALSGRAQAREHLGYRGLEISGDQSESVAKILVSEGVVIIQGTSGDTSTRGDWNRGLERWLIETGTQTLDPALLTVLRQDIERP